MVWESMALMGLIDIVIAVAAVWAVAAFYRSRHVIRKLGVGSSVIWIVLGLTIICAFYLGDLFVIVVLPSLTSLEHARAVMMDLHLNWSWIGSLVAVGCIALGLWRPVRVILPRASRLFDEETARRAHAEEDLRESAESQLALFEAMNEGVRVIEDGVHTLVNRRFCAMTGYSRDELIGAPSDMVFDEEYVEIARRQNEVRVEGERESYEVTLIGKDGRRVPVIRSAQALFGVDGEVRGSIGVFTDITERKRIEKALSESEERVRTVLDNVADGIVTSDEEGRILSFNPAAEQLFGYTADEVIGRNVSILAEEPDRGAHDGYIRRYLDTGKGKILGIGPREVVGRCKDGLTFPAELAISEMHVGGERVFIATVRDATRRKAAESQLIQAQKMDAVGQLTGGVAHDFNNLLAVILGNLELIDEALEENDDLRDLTGQALAATLRGAALTDRLLAFSRRQMLRPEVTDVNKLVAGMADILARTLGETIAFETVRAGGLWKTMIDPGQLENSLLNLAINARDAMPEGGKLTIETANAHLDEDYAEGHVEVEPGQYVMLAVTDTGTGMTPEVMEQVFDPFFTTKETGSGVGLGLSMVFGFIKQSAGHIAFYSEVGKGTTVKLYLPRTLQTPGNERDRTGPARPEGGHGETILVVEDDESVRQLTATLLTKLGYRVLEAGDGPSALEVLERTPEIDLLLTDVVLPGGMSGHDVARAAQLRRPEIKVLYISGYTQNAIIHNGTLDADMELLSKPFQKEALARKVRRVLDDDKS